MNIEQRSRVHAALGDPVRLAVAESLLQSDRTPSWLADALDIRSNLLAHHVNVLADAAVVRRGPSEADRRRTYLTLTEVGRRVLGTTPITAHKVLFVCTHNSARSQFAEALWRRRSKVPVASAGTEPAARINPRAQSVAAAAGLILDGLPELLEQEMLDETLVVSVCDNADEDLHMEHLHWSVPDPMRGTDFQNAFHTIAQRVDCLAPAVSA